ncbi:MAG: penicillin-binding protein 2 [Candidatus Latescibacteria bacterium]|nr:penicillin-binding protein 2 [Candidatus Latescibacterota bacterium]
MNISSLDDRDKGRRMRHLLGFALGLFCLLAVRLFYLQITSAEDYARESEENCIAQKRIKAPRGIIFDREKRILARNRGLYTISLERTNKRNYDEVVHSLQQALGEDWVPQDYNKRAKFIRLLRDVDFRTVSIVEERLQDRWPLLGIEIEAQRFYPEGSLAAHLLGYMGELREADLQGRRIKNHVAGDYFGKTGVERVYEDLLRGEDGVRYLEVDAERRTIREFTEREQPAQKGQDLTLTIDLNVQRAAEEALPDSLSGAVVALNAQTGAVLALVSKPTFDPNIFVSFRAQGERRRVLQSKTALLNRTTQGQYPPGSTLKMLAAVAGLETGNTDTLSTFPACAGSLRVGDVVFRCYRGKRHGSLNLIEAIEASCNIYFHHLAQNLSIEEWWAFGQKFGFGEPTGLDAEPREMGGLLPSREYFQQTQGWTQGHLMNLVIGQGSMLATPIQMARYTAALANGGYLVRPYVYGDPGEPVKIAGVSAGTYDIIKKSMRRVVYGEHGTGSAARIDRLVVSGKSGTSQVPNRKEDDAWFVAFAPYDKPLIAVAVVVEGGGPGGSVAGPVARRVIEAFAGFESVVQDPAEPKPARSAETAGQERRGGLPFDA